MRNRNDLIEAVDSRADKLDVGALLADGHDFQATRRCRFNDLLRIAIINADDGCAARHNQIFEQAKLGRQISFDARMIVEMISRQVRKRTGRDAHSVEPMLVETV